MAIQMGQPVTMEQAAVKATAQARHYEFIEKMAAMMREYNVEIYGNMDGEVTVWTNHGGECMSAEFGHVVTAEEVQAEMRFKEFNVETVEHIFNNYTRWAAERAARAAHRNQEQAS